MNVRRPSPRWALWVFAAALLLKSAMPWLASTSAEWQGKALVEVCTAYGVSLVPLQNDAPNGAPDDTPAHNPEHGGAHCALTVFAALAPVALPAALPAVLRLPAIAPPPARPSPRSPDACATWVARLKHGPPGFA